MSCQSSPKVRWNSLTLIIGISSSTCGIASPVAYAKDLPAANSLNSLSSSARSTKFEVLESSFGEESKDSEDINVGEPETGSQVKFT